MYIGLTRVRDDVNGICLSQQIHFIDAKSVNAALEEAKAKAMSRVAELGITNETRLALNQIIVSACVYECNGEVSLEMESDDLRTENAHYLSFAKHL